LPCGCISTHLPHISDIKKLKAPETVGFQGLFAKNRMQLAGIEPTSQESESCVLSVRLQLQRAVTYSIHILAHLAKQSKDLLCKKLKNRTLLKNKHFLQ
jgi:hypothetical protein